MIRKVFTIIILSIALGCFLFLKPFFFQKSIEARLIDRLPSSDFIGKLNILELARETSGMLYYHKLPFRDLMTQEFLLSQGKSYGLNLQKPIYLFGNEVDDWGCLIYVNDSSKIALGIQRIRKSVTVVDSLIENQKVFFNKKDNFFMHYGLNYVLVYKGSKFKKVLNYVVKAKYKKIQTIWSKFFNDKHFRKEHLVIHANQNKFKTFGIESAIFAHDSDSMSFNLKSYFKKKTSFYFKQKKSGFAFSSIPDPNKAAELHLDVSELEKHLDDPLIIEVMKLGKRIGFPFNDFIRAWEGDICFIEGGTEKIKEGFIETELDENFNSTDVQKYRDVLVPGYSLYLSTNKNGSVLINKLFAKGIMTSEGDKIRVLYSPLLSLKQTKSYIQLYSGARPPKLVNSTSNSLIWKNKGTIYSFKIDSLNKNEIFGSLQIPVKRIFRRNKFI